MAAAAGAALALALGALGFLAHVAGWLKSAVHYLVTAPRFNPVGFGGLLSRLSVFLGLREAAPAPPLGGFLEALLDWAGRFSFSSPPPPGIGAGVAGAALESATRRLFSASPRILAEEVRAAGRVVQSRSFICPTCQQRATTEVHAVMWSSTCHLFIRSTCGSGRSSNHLDDRSFDRLEARYN